MKHQGTGKRLLAQVLVPNVSPQLRRPHRQKKTPKQNPDTYHAHTHEPETTVKVNENMRNVNQL